MTRSEKVSNIEKWKPRDKFWVWQVGMYLYFSNKDYITQIGGRYISLCIPDMGRDLNVPTHRLRGYLRELLDLDLIEELKIHTSSVVVKLKVPNNIRDNGISS